MGTGLITAESPHAELAENDHSHGSAYTSASSRDQTLSPVQQLLALGPNGESVVQRPDPDACLSINVDGSGRLSASLFGKALDRSAEALTVPLPESARLMAVAAAKARRPLVVRTDDEHGRRHIDVLDPPPVAFHQVPSEVVDAAASADAIRFGLPPAIWSAERVHWTPIPFTGTERSLCRRRLQPQQARNTDAVKWSRGKDR